YLVLRAEGKVFSAGMDIAEHFPEKAEEMLASARRLMMALCLTDVPVVALVEGSAYGGGLEVLLACDVVLAREDVTLGLPEVRVGAFPPFASVTLPFAVPWAQA